MTPRRLERLGRATMAVWALLYLGLGLWGVLAFPTPSLRATVLAVDTGYAGLWLLYWLRIAGTGRPRLVLAAAGACQALLAVALLAALPGHPFPVGSAQLVAIIFLAGGLGWRAGLVATGALALSTLVLDAAQGLGPALVPVDFGEALTIGLLTILIRMLIVSYVQLYEAREQIARLAVAEERLRFARDLHDLLGQSLVMIVLKSEVVARRLPAGADPGLRDELGDVTRVARRSLDEVREAVAGYRQPSLDTELAAAREALRLARVQVAIENTAPRLGPAEEGVLGWALREAVTNVVKHSGARRCRISVTEADGWTRLEVADDGRGAEAAAPPGNGLRGIRERAALAGGDAQAGPDGAGFRVVVTVPRPGVAAAEAAPASREVTAR